MSLDSLFRIVANSFLFEFSYIESGKLNLAKLPRNA